jgi:hypothetical protein
MSDLEKFIELYKSLGIELKPTQSRNKEITLHLEEGEHEKFQGYSNFYSDIVFDKNGKFLYQGFYE